MGLYIKDMEIPTSCGKCKLFDMSHAIGLFSPLGWCRVNGKVFGWNPIPCKYCGGALSEIREHNGKRYRHCYSCHFEFFEEES